MSRHWSYFAAAALLAAMLLFTHGAPPAAIAFGIAGAALWMWHRKSHLS
jgi:predicted membrane metal-binding protein